MPGAGQQRYTSSIKDMPFLLLEMRKAAGLMAQGYTPDTIVRLSVAQNIFQLDKERRRLELAQEVTARLAAIPPSVAALIANGQDENARLGAFYALLQTDLLFFEFTREAYGDRVRLGQTGMADSDVALFLASKAGENERISNWTARTLVQVKNIYMRILAEAGLAKAEGTGLRLTRPVMNDELRAAWDKPDPYTAAMCLEVYIVDENAE